MDLIFNFQDGIRVNQYGWTFPFFKNFLVTPDRKTKMVVEKFLALYFTYYDDRARRKIETFYDVAATLTMISDFSGIVINLLLYFKNKNYIGIKKYVILEMCRLRLWPTSWNISSKYP